MSFSQEVYNEGIAAEHPDIEGQDEFKKKADEIIDARRKRRVKKSGPQLPSFVRTVRKQQNEEKDHEHSMARGEIHKIDKAIKTLSKKLKGEGNIEAWVQSKITRAADYLDAASNYLDSGEHDGQVNESTDDDIPELRSRRITDASSSSSPARRGRKSPGELMRMLNQDLPKPKKKKKKKKDITEETMTSAQKAKEEKLKKKYDDSDMKQNMIDQYGQERGTQIYFSKIRKMAMQEGFIDPEDEIPTSSGRPGRKPIENVASHPNSKVRRKAIEAMRRQMEKEYGGRWKTKSKDPAVEEDFDYLDEAKLSRAARRAAKAERPDTPRRPKHVVQLDLDQAALREVGTRKKKNPETGKKETIKVEPAKINVKGSSGDVVRTVSTGDFHREREKLSKGETMDYTPLRDPKKFIQTTKANKHVINKSRGAVVEPNTARGAFRKNVGEEVSLDEAKGQVDNKSVIQHLKNIGYNEKRGMKIKPGHFTGDMPGSGSPGKKLIATKRDIEKYRPEKISHIDDDPKNLEPLEAHRKETQGKRGEKRGDAPKIHTQLVSKFRKRGESRVEPREHGRVRRFSGVRTPGAAPTPQTTRQIQRARKKARKGMVSNSYDYIDVVYDFILEKLILEEIAENYDDASAIVEMLDDELLEDLIAESHQFIQNTLEENYSMNEEKEFKIDYQSPYKKIQEKREIKKDYLQEEQELTPYEYWKSFIGDDEEVETVTEDVEVAEELNEEVEMTSYEKWKKILA